MDVFPLETGGFPLLCRYVGLLEVLQPQPLHGSNLGNWVFSGSMTIEVFPLFFFGEPNVVELEGSRFILHKPWTVESCISWYPSLSSGEKVRQNIKHDHFSNLRKIFKLRMVNHLSLFPQHQNQSTNLGQIFSPWMAVESSMFACPT